MSRDYRETTLHLLLPEERVTVVVRTEREGRTDARLEAAHMKAVRAALEDTHVAAENRRHAEAMAGRVGTPFAKGEEKRHRAALRRFRGSVWSPGGRTPAEARKGFPAVRYGLDPATVAAAHEGVTYEEVPAP